MEEGGDEMGIMDLDGKFLQDISVCEIMAGETINKVKFDRFKEYAYLSAVNFPSF